jgi:hypothetical protein
LDHGDDDDDDGEDIENFRNGYLFDAILLGFCDDVTAALLNALFCKKDQRKEHKKDQQGSSGCDEGSSGCDDGTIGQPIQSSSKSCHGKLLCHDMAKVQNIEAKCLLNHPPERIVMFPGAVLDAPQSDEDGSSFCEVVVNCDECQAVITGTSFKCSKCFDYDLCDKCYWKVSKNKSHHGGTHKFLKEQVQI